MIAIYEPKGKAGEYSKLACNLYRGCPHRCAYCYAPNATRTDKTAFAQVRPREGIIEALEKKAGRMSFNPPAIPILLCFTCDPYPPPEAKYELTRHAIQILHRHGLSVKILTKGGRLAERDFELYQPGDWFGVSLTCLNSTESLQWEPGAKLPEDRITSLKVAHDKGIRTWVSLEPVINPEWTLALIKETAAFVDEYKIGKMNYHPIAKTVDWRQFGNAAIDLCKKMGKNYYIKNDLERLLR